MLQDDYLKLAGNQSELKDEQILSFLRQNKYVGLIHTNPNVEELLVPVANTTTEVNSFFKTNFTEHFIKELLRKQGITRRSDTEFLALKKQAKAR